VDGDDAPLATLLRGGDRAGLRYSRGFDHRPGAVWRALTESESLRHWLPTDIVGERRVGAQITLPFWPDTVEKYGLQDQAVLHGKVERWEPPEVFAWTWDTDELLFELEDVPASGDAPGRTLLTFTTWLGDGSPEALVDVGAGYHSCLDLLAELLDRGPGHSTAEVDPALLEARYAAHFGSG